MASRPEIMRTFGNGIEPMSESASSAIALFKPCYLGPSPHDDLPNCYTLTHPLPPFHSVWELRSHATLHPPFDSRLDPISLPIIPQRNMAWLATWTPHRSHEAK